MLVRSAQKPNVVRDRISYNEQILISMQGLNRLGGVRRLWETDMEPASDETVTLCHVWVKVTHVYHVSGRQD